MTTNPQAQTEQELKEPEFQFEIFKLEYEQAVERYENIYKAIWQIFSYLTALTAAIVAFGANNLSSLVVVSIAPLPLVFWLIAIYIPMDFYGNQSRKRLADMEKGINENFLMGYPETLKLKHFSNFTQQSETPSNQPPWRVKRAIFIFAGLAVLAWIFLAFLNLNQLKPKFSRMEIELEPPVQVQVQAPQLQGLESEIELLSKKLDSIESFLHARNIATPNDAGKP